MMCGCCGFGVGSLVGIKVIEASSCGAKGLVEGGAGVRGGCGKRESRNVGLKLQKLVAAILWQNK